MRLRTLSWPGWRVTASHAAPTFLDASSDTPLVQFARRAEPSDSWLVRLVNDSVRSRTKHWGNSKASLVHPTRSVDGGKLVPLGVVLRVAGGEMFSRTDSSTGPATSSVAVVVVVVVVVVGGGGGGVVVESYSFLIIIIVDVLVSL